MNEKCKWLYRYIKSCIQCKGLKKVMPFEKFREYRIKYFSKYVGRSYDVQQANEQLKKWIEEGRPFAVTRNGMAETVYFASLIKDSFWGTSTYKKHMALKGYFNNKAEIQEYKRIIEDCYENSDIVCAWYVLVMEEYQLHELAQKAIITRTRLVDEYDYPGCWIQSLEGKRVLVVSPFIETMQEQYKKRKQLHRLINTLPDFTLLTVKSVWWYSDGKDQRFKSWNEVLEYLYDECMKEKFDIALLSCGTFSTPLAVKLKKAGKQAVQMGGALQLLFGIKGKRWDDKGIYNEYWVRLPDSTKLGNVDVLDHTQGGIYW